MNSTNSTANDAESSQATSNPIKQTRCWIGSELRLRESLLLGLLESRVAPSGFHDELHLTILLDMHHVAPLAELHN
jgi:hypothetical protein